MRNDINIAIVDMVEQQVPTVTNGTSSSCYVPEESTNSTVIQVNETTSPWIGIAIHVNWDIFMKIHVWLLLIILNSER